MGDQERVIHVMVSAEGAVGTSWYQPQALWPDGSWQNTSERALPFATQALLSVREHRESWDSCVVEGGAGGETGEEMAAQRPLDYRVIEVAVRTRVMGEREWNLPRKRRSGK